MAKTSSSPLNLLLLLSPLSFLLSMAQSPIPAHYDGFLYGAVSPWEASVLVEAFMDPMCPDSRDAWPSLKQAFQHYSPLVSLIVHPFPLPYHDNSYLTCRALHIANMLNISTTFPLLEFFFDHQKKWSNSATQYMSKQSIINDITKHVSLVIGNSSISAFQSGFADSHTDKAARVSFRYGCSRGVAGTPYFFVNGFLLPGGGSALDYKQWRKIIDPLLTRAEGQIESTII
ncbi:uncharacterized protein LOC120260836 [Dioscorea cayenensis subsp. rotundata]|uniref:Uncharacterized protein LOC120260836 n=1 Tax=Dioscorea cayennensis subsp. rotundata TaxID=55577 RepID=A0AB40BB92_DIOCR|nr:uncharacterized protein LOC120260836 [Dioscorea cayenensis subsp. rotundata]